MVQFFCFFTEWERADNDNQLVALSGELRFRLAAQSTRWACAEQWEVFLTTTLSAGVEWLQAEMGPGQVWRHQETAHPVQTHLAPWHRAVQQVSLSTQANGWTSFLFGLTSQNCSIASVEWQIHYFLYSNVFRLYHWHKRGWKKMPCKHVFHGDFLIKNLIHIPLKPVFAKVKWRGLAECWIDVLFRLNSASREGEFCLSDWHRGHV